ncbi:cytochrome c [Nitratireductor basaltis]|uniref:Gluconate 2-dehydrogenase (Acceptor) n=1 Tax=Nitratireductor basaltis TaxID=472175 RepID=A0A084UCJ8_9HYPH|nr:cytochrome c [Nitratireductor basaltis]KFB10684.1 Gluconate 2-dehydrogenase (Acceptor) [Nitratireductor basaltis]
MRKLAFAAAAVAVAAGAGFWFLTGPDRLEASEIASVESGDAARGEAVFWAGGCASCHAAPDAEGEARTELGGGLELATEFGTFVAPNISSHPEDGIGAWSEEDFLNAMMRGVSPDGRHYYPAFPYTSYARMDPQDVADLFAFMKTLPAVEGEAEDHQIGFPFNIRRGLGLWKALHLNSEPILALPDNAPEELLRGRYLVEGPGHCGECHSPRDFSGGIKRDEWLAGAVSAEGDGVVPNITPGEGGIESWSQSDIAYYLESGFTPDFDSVGGAMVSVQKNMAQLEDADRQAIAAYLKAVEAKPDGYSSSR